MRLKNCGHDTFCSDKAGGLGIMQPWATRKISKVGDKKSSTTCEAIGRALTQWEYLESKLAELFAVLVSAEWETSETPTDPAIRAYGSIVGTAARLTMIDEAAKAYFRIYKNKVLEKKLSDFITTECRPFAGQRNNIAHGIVEIFFSSTPKLKLGYWLVPSFYGTKKNPMDAPRSYAYTSTEINYYTKQFDLLWVKAGKLIHD